MQRDTVAAYPAQILATLAAVRITSSTSFSWLGRPVGEPPTDLRRLLSLDESRNHLIAVLSERLYSRAYCVGGPRSDIPAPSAHAATFNGSLFGEALVAANRGIGRWERGWLVTWLSEREAGLTDGRIELRAPRSICMAADHDVLHPGASAMLWSPKDVPALSPGFYSARSDAPFAPSSSGRVARIYWNLTADTAITLMRSVTTSFNSKDVPFLLKVRADPGGFNRCDSGVLYLSLADVQTALQLLSPIYSEIGPILRPAVPMFTLPIAPGVAVAIDPGAGMSFGMHRCRLLAEAILGAHARSLRTQSERLVEVKSKFEESRVAIDAPYKSTDDDLDTSAFRGRSLRPVRAVRAIGSAGNWLEVAARLSDRLCRDAIWHGSQCNWLGPIPGASHSRSLDGPSVLAPLGTDLYGGTSGIALFLAEFATRSGCNSAKRTAIGAIRRSLEESDLPAQRSVGLYTGRIGTALAATRVGSALADSSLVEQAVRLTRLTHEERHGAGNDLLSGLAGTVVGLLSLWESLGDGDMLARALICGQDLLRAGTLRDSAASSRPSRVAGPARLTGFSHGASGIGYAFNELAFAMQSTSFRDAAREAFAYERGTFDQGAQNWPDLRVEVVRRAKRRRGFMTSWCHGAPGIALARLRAFELFGDEVDRDEARIALQTTSRSTSDDLSSGLANFSLCHGLSGNAGVLVEGCRVMSSSESPPSLALDVATAGSLWCAGEYQEWPCGAGTGTAPGLMMGLAGIGYFYLALADSALPTVLAFGRKSGGG